ncbi:MAG TPA: vitamin K epoxide reductase family protein [Gemmatimonadales bacterium]|nr:vitamin K epoxide reductase family protein [Gemmatimonadales bacterium]
MIHRMVAATLALAGFFVSFYLWLWKLGVVGSLACGPGGGCEYVQTSPWAMIFGIPVALFGVVGYLVLFTVSLIGLQPGWAQRREPTLALVALSGAAVLFTAYLTYLEAAVIHAWCRWCLVSAGIIVAIFMASLAGLPRSGTQAQRHSGM